MALSNENGGIPATMLVGPANGYAGYGNGMGGFGADGWWIILLFILLGNGNWGCQNGGYAHPVYGGVQQGFDQAAVMGGLNGIQSGLNGIQNSIQNGFANAETAANARQVANMQQMYAMSSQFADCCCENRLAACQTQNTIQNEGNATRFADANNTRDILENCNRNNQAVLDKLCQLELDNKNTRIADLERQLTMANLAASQNAQTSRILADNAAQTVALEQYLNPTPIPAYMVQNPNCCQQNVCGNF